MDILTQYVTNGQGKGQIRATTKGTQRTWTYDHEATPARNHGSAAGVLAKAAIAKQVGAGTAADYAEAFTKAALWATAEDLGEGRWRFTV